MREKCQHCRLKPLVAAVILLGISLALVGTDSYGQGVDDDKYLALRDSHLKLLRKEDLLKDDIHSLKLDIAELTCKLRVKLDRLREKQRKLDEVGADIRDLERLM